MKTTFLTITTAVTLFFTSLTTYCQDTEIESENGKEFLLEYYEQTKAALLESIAGLSEAQMQYKPGDDRWSVADCVEHIAISEKGLVEMLQARLKEPASPERRDEITLTDEEVIEMITSRDFKAKAPEAIHPTGAFSDAESAAEGFMARRDETVAYLGGIATEELRNHITDSPIGVLDAYKFALFISAHTARHTLQIKEVKADEGFPSK